MGTEEDGRLGIDKKTINALKNLVRIGTVTDVNHQKREVRVKFLNTNLTSGWLRVLNNVPAIPDYEGNQQTEFEAGGSSEASFASHKHNLTIKQWMPKVNDTVLTLYLPVFNGDGFVLGGI